MKCPNCGAEVLHDGESTTLVGYAIFEDALGEHHHDDNCLKRRYHCTTCDAWWIESIIRTCNLIGCTWRGKDKCFCHAGMKVEKWTDPPHSEHEDID